MPAFSSASRSRFARVLLALAFAALPLACGGSNLLGIPSSWTLQTVANAPPPYTVPNATHAVVITSATASLYSNGNYTSAYMGTTDGVAGQVASDQGTWTVSSSTIIFHSSPLGGMTYIAALTGNRYRAAVPGQLFGSSNSSIDMEFQSN